jgi:hypothetical protein
MVDGKVEVDVAGVDVNVEVAELPCEVRMI